MYVFEIYFHLDSNVLEYLFCVSCSELCPGNGVVPNFAGVTRMPEGHDMYVIVNVP